jgi:hypothetical protein
MATSGRRRNLVRELGCQIDLTERNVTMTRNYHVTRNPNGGWDAKAEGTKRASSNHRTQDQAEAAAKSYSAKQGGGEVRIHRPDGTIRDSDTVPPARDPNPPKDKRH